MVFRSFYRTELIYQYIVYDSCRIRASMQVKESVKYKIESSDESVSIGVLCSEYYLSDADSSTFQTGAIFDIGLQKTVCSHRHLLGNLIKYIENKSKGEPNCPSCRESITEVIHNQAEPIQDFIQVEGKKRKEPEVPEKRDIIPSRLKKKESDTTWRPKANKKDVTAPAPPTFSTFIMPFADFEQGVLRMMIRKMVRQTLAGETPKGDPSLETTSALKNSANAKTALENFGKLRKMINDLEFGVDKNPDRFKMMSIIATTTTGGVEMKRLVGLAFVDEKITRFLGRSFHEDIVAIMAKVDPIPLDDDFYWYSSVRQLANEISLDTSKIGKTVKTTEKITEYTIRLRKLLFHAFYGDNGRTISLAKQEKLKEYLGMFLVYQKENYTKFANDQSVHAWVTQNPYRPRRGLKESDWITVLKILAQVVQKQADYKTPSSIPEGVISELYDTMEKGLVALLEMDAGKDSANPQVDRMRQFVRNIVEECYNGSYLPDIYHSELKKTPAFMLEYTLRHFYVAPAFTRYNIIFGILRYMRYMLMETIENNNAYFERAFIKVDNRLGIMGNPESLGFLKDPRDENMFVSPDFIQQVENTLAIGSEAK